MSKQIKDKVRKTIRRTDEQKQLLEKGSRILAAEMTKQRDFTKPIMTKEQSKAFSDALHKDMNSNDNHEFVL
ncbi:hypothetical protein ACH4RN_000661 [Providencia rettgeri]